MRELSEPFSYEPKYIEELKTPTDVNVFFSFLRRRVFALEFIGLFIQYHRLQVSHYFQNQ